jgi:molybdopterin molybdotransferase
MIKKQVSPHIKEFLIPDEEEKIFQTIKTAFETSDVVITTGRISEGKLDVVKNALARIPELKFENWRVMMKPGRPFIFGVYREKKYIFGLPGNPVSAAVSYSLIVRPALLKMTGCSNIDLPVEECELAEDILNPGNRRHFVRVKIDVNKKAKTSGLQTSYSLSSLLNSSGLVDVPPRSVLEKGSIVKVLKWDISD